MEPSRGSPVLARHARQVGYALSALRDGTSVPWHRVINAQGRLSLERAASSAGVTQMMRLAREGVRRRRGRPYVADAVRMASRSRRSRPPQREDVRRPRREDEAQQRSRPVRRR